MSSAHEFDLAALRRNWAEPEQKLDESERSQLNPACLPIDFVTEVPRKLAELRQACETEFPGQMLVLDRFLREVEAAGARWVELENAGADEGQAAAEDAMAGSTAALLPEGTTADGTMALAVGSSVPEQATSESPAAATLPGAADAEPVEDSFEQDPRERLQDAFGSLEDLLEVFASMGVG